MCYTLPYADHHPRPVPPGSAGASRRRSRTPRPGATTTSSSHRLRRNLPIRHPPPGATSGGAAHHPLTPGHEIAGTVTAVGSAVTRTSGRSASVSAAWSTAATTRVVQGRPEMFCTKPSIGDRATARGYDGEWTGYGYASRSSSPSAACRDSRRSDSTSPPCCCARGSRSFSPPALGRRGPHEGRHHRRRRLRAHMGARRSRPRWGRGDLDVPDRLAGRRPLPWREPPHRHRGRRGDEEWPAGPSTILNTVSADLPRTTTAVSSPMASRSAMSDRRWSPLPVFFPWPGSAATRC